MGKAFGHLFLALIIPFVGWKSTSLHETSAWRPRLLWIFHIGNVMFCLIHTLLFFAVWMEVNELDGASVAAMCDSRKGNDPDIGKAGSGPPMFPTMAPATLAHREC